MSNGFIWYEYTLKDGTKDKIHAENIYEAMEMLVRVHQIHPTDIIGIVEK